MLLDRAVSGLAVDTVVTDDHLAASAATRRLIEFGHHRIAYISAVNSGEVCIPKPRTKSTRRRCWIASMAFWTPRRQAGIEAPERYIRLGATDSSMTRKIVTDLLSSS